MSPDKANLSGFQGKKGDTKDLWERRSSSLASGDGVWSHVAKYVDKSIRKNLRNTMSLYSLLSDDPVGQDSGFRSLALENIKSTTDKYHPPQHLHTTAP